MQPDAQTEYGSSLRFRDFSVAIHSFLFVVFIPTLLAALYFGFVASDIYVAEARYAIRTSSESPAGGLVEAVLGTTSTSTSAGEDAMVVSDYILSRDMLEELDKLLQLRRHFSSKDIDLLSRLDEGTSFEDFLEYYQGKVEIEIETGSFISTLRVRAFDPETAQKLAGLIIDLSEALVNRMTERIVEDTLRFARSEVSVAEERIRRASNALTGFRSVSRSIDPSQETSAVLGIVTQLESNLAAERTELIQLESYMNSDSVQIKNLRARVNALEKQVKNERQRLSADGENISDYTRLIDKYEPLVLEKTLAEQRYSSALTSLEAARAEAQRKQRYLITFVSPRLPDDSVEPERIMAVITVFVGSLVAYAIGALVWAAIKDHLRI